MNFADKLISAIKNKGNGVCVGLDPRLAQLPNELTGNLNRDDSHAVANAFESFCIEVIEQVHNLVPIVKPQSAFFEALGPDGVKALAKVVAHARSRNLLVLMDAKRGDIGSTAEAYAQAYLATGGLESDALTVNPYMGVDTLQPFVDAARDNAKGLFVLVKTSNPGSGHFQDKEFGESKQTLFELVAEEVEKLSNDSVGDSGYGIVGAVVGATYPEQLEQLRHAMPHSILLIPGFGAQGGGVDDVRAGFDESGLGAIVNSSRGIIFAYNKEEYQDTDWRSAIRLECEKTAGLLSVEALRR